VECSKSEETAQNAVARLLALRVLGYLIRTGLAIQDSKDRNFIEVLVEKAIGGKRGSLRHLLICNYEPPRKPIYSTVASKTPLMNLFGPAECSERDNNYGVDG